jgi:Holliday junction resolvase RusA-like endonuclease
MNNDYIQKIIHEINCKNIDIDKIKKLIIQLYNEQNNDSIDENIDVNSEQCVSLIRCFNKLLINEQIPKSLFLKPEIKLLRKLFVSISEKASFLAGYHCPFCTSSFPIITIPIRISPISKQASSSKKFKAFCEAIEYKFTTSNFDKVEKFYNNNTKLCIRITFVFKENTRDKDLDNLAKSILDATKKVLFKDDMQIDHLSLFKIKGSKEEYIYINIRESNINSHEDVIFKTTAHGWGGQKAIELEDFM